MDDHEPWQLTGNAAELYERYLVPAITEVWAADLVQRAALGPGEQILDVACGTGIVARLAAPAVGERGKVVGLDINTGMLAIARILPPPAGAPITWVEGSVLNLPFPGATFDVVLCQLGLQFFPDRPHALRELERVLRPGGRLLLSVFGPIEHSPATYALTRAVERHLGADAGAIKRAEHVLADVETVHALVAGAGFADVTIETVTQEIHFPSPRAYVRMQLAATPLAALVEPLDPEPRRALVEAVIGDVTNALRAYERNGELVVPQECHLLSARAAKT